MDGWMDDGWMAAGGARCVCARSPRWRW
jgi:hypothetical protein